MKKSDNFLVILKIETRLKTTSSLPAFRRRYQLVHKAQNRNVLLIAWKNCKKQPAYGRSKACNPARLRVGRLLSL
jgi:hypothetical protein